jgi:4-hydroxybenzoyl-CoA thioesterase
MSRIFETTAPLRFAECDPAGIAFYPRLVERVNNVVEDWFAAEIGVSFADMHREGGERVGVPCRSLALEFLNPGRLGEPLTLALTLSALGRSSISLAIAARLGDGRPMFMARPTLVWCAYRDGALRAAPIPDAVRARMVPFQAPETGVAQTRAAR